MAVDYLSAINRQGSGLNITEIVDSLVEAETAPQVDKIQKDIDQKNAAISGYALVASELDKFKTFTDLHQFKRVYCIVDMPFQISVSTADAKAFNVSISVSSLAQSQTLEFSGFSSKNAAINTGNITIDYGSWSNNTFTADSTKSASSVAITSSNNTLTGLAESLSALDGVNATVTDKGDGTFSLIINSDTGQKNALRMTVSEDSSDPGLSTFDTSSNNSSKQVVAASDASININGVTVTRTTNTVTDLIDGYQFKLNATTSTTATVSSVTDQSVAYQKIKEFVDSYNGIISTLDSLTQRCINGEYRGVLARDLTVNSIQRNLRSIITAELPGTRQKVDIVRTGVKI